MGRLGDGQGKWRLSVRASATIEAMSLLASPPDTSRTSPRRLIDTHSATSSLDRDLRPSSTTTSR